MPIKEAEDLRSRGLERVFNEQIGVSEILSDVGNRTGGDLLTCETTLLTYCEGSKESDCLDSRHHLSASATEAASRPRNSAAISGLVNRRHRVQQKEV